jgi:hypothetical protein
VETGALQYRVVNLPHLGREKKRKEKKKKRKGTDIDNQVRNSESHYLTH